MRLAASNVLARASTAAISGRKGGLPVNGRQEISNEGSGAQERMGVTSG
jgi:hypothetical protein